MDIPDEGVLGRGAETWAAAYFERPANVEKSRAPGLCTAAGVLIGRLQVAARESEGWRGMAEFDSRLDEAAAAGGLAAVIPPGVREQARMSFARAWLEVARHEEAERQRAAAFLAAFTAATSKPGDIEVAPQPETEVREGDMTVDELVEAFRLARERPDLDKQYGHIFRALREILGGDKPMRAVSRADVRDIKKFLSTLPANATKIYPKLTLAQAAERGAEDGRKLIAPNTVRSYLLNLSALCRWAVNEGQMTANPCADQVPPKRNAVKRRGFTVEELTTVFGALADDRERDSARWWVPAVLAFTGARANEIAQLHVEDVKEAHGVHFLDMSLFDDEGRRLDRRKLKTDASARAVPIHSRLVEAGFLEFVEKRRRSGEERLFPELKANKLGYYTHDLSKWWGRHLDRSNLSEPSLCLHSLRHGFKDSAEAARLPEYIVKGLGGWAARDQMEKYGERCSPARVRENADHLELVTLGGFTLGAAPGSPQRAEAA